jgi:hypothetical protein
LFWFCVGFLICGEEIYGLILLRKNKNVYTKDAALKLEAEISLKMHNRGYRVFGDGLTRAIKHQNL